MKKLVIKSSLSEQTTLFIESFLADTQNHYICHPAFVELNFHYFSWDKVILEYFEEDILSAVLIGNSVNGKFVSIPHFSYAGFYAKSLKYKQNLLNELIRSERFSSIQIREDQDYECFTNASDKVSGYIQLASTYEEQLTRFSSKLRSQVKRSTQFDLKYESGNMPVDVDNFYQGYSKHMHTLGSFPMPLGYLKKLFEMNGKMKPQVNLVWLNEKCVAGGVTISHNNVIEIVWAYSLRPYNKFQTNIFLYSRIIENAIAQKLSTFSFGRTSGGSSGLRFKRQWGTTIYHLAWNTWPPKKIYGTSLASSLATKISKYLPLQLRVMIAEYVHRIKY